jgi:hypothetical protein
MMFLLFECDAELYTAGAASPLSELVAWLLYKAGADPLVCP